jgi:GNAT superfamily N-acetyltransferase
MVHSSAAVVEVRDAVVRDSFAVNSVLTDACIKTPFGRGLVSEPSVRRGCAQVFMGGLVTATIADGIVRLAVVNGEVLGAALWSMHHGTGRPVRTDAADEGGVEAASVPQVWRRQLQELADDRCPSGVGHHRLRYIGVDPDRQGLGIGAELLIQHHALLHLMRIPALVVTDHAGEPFFERHRYSRIGPTGLLPGGVPMLVMWRNPEPADPV